MTPNDIEVLIHCHTTPTAHPRADAPAVENSIIWMLRDELIKPERDIDGVYATTQRGKALVKMLCETPLPVWKDPR